VINMSIHSEAVRKFVGKPAKDIYGRYIGYVIGVSFDATGNLNSVGIDRGHDSFEEYPRSQILLDNETLVLIPTWKIDAANFKKENEVTKRRFEALDDLVKDKEIPDYVYDELCKQYKESLNRLDETHQTLSEKLTNMAQELEAYIRTLERFLGNLKVQHKTGEISDETYTTVCEYLKSGIEKSLKEKTDVQDILDSLNTSKEDKSLNTSTEPTVQSQPIDSSIQEEKPKEEDSEPVVVHLQMPQT
jgi:hemoglobin-like flavoprotein